MFPALLIGMEGWSSKRCKLIWKLKGTRSHRLYFQLAPSTLRTEETEFGLLPTVKTWDAKNHSPNSGKETKIVNGQVVNVRKDGTTFGPLLIDLAKNNLLPTPQAIDGQGKGRDLRLKTGNRNPESPGSWRGDLKDFAVNGLLPTPTAKDEKSGCKRIPGGRIDRKISQGWTIELNDLAVNGMLPTPAMRDYKGGNSMEHLTRKEKSEGNSHQDQLPNFIKLKTGSSSQLNPRFVMEMMGFPPDWTELPFLSGETNQSKPEEMP